MRYDLLWEQRKKEVYRVICERENRALRVKEIALLLDIPMDERAELEDLLEEMSEEGLIEHTVRNKYKKKLTRYVEGIFRMTSRGFGFVQTGEDEPDVFIPQSGVADAMHGDRVRVKVTREGERPEGEITHVTQRGTTETIGVYYKNRTYGYVKPEEERLCPSILVQLENSRNAANMDLVVVRFLSYGTGGKGPEGEIIRIIGNREKPGTDMEAVLYQYHLEQDFPSKVLEEADRIIPAVTQEEMTGRMDYRDMLTVTIDGEDARDLDDAISLYMEDGTYHLLVHIADVSHYVREGSALDGEARTRGTSVYLPDRVIPMLPPVLSNGICSLDQGRDRLTLTCRMEFDGQGTMRTHTLEESVIRVDHRLSYSQVQKFFESEDWPGPGGEDRRTNENGEKLLLKESSGEENMPTDEALAFMLRQMRILAEALSKKRENRGAPDFDFPEGTVLLDSEGRAVDIILRERSEATRLIESFMIAANEAVAEDAFWQHLPFLYRVHEAPDPEEVRSLANMIVQVTSGSPRNSRSKKKSRKSSAGNGADIKQDRAETVQSGQKRFSEQYVLHGAAHEVHPRDVRNLLQEIKGSDKEWLIGQMALRCMKQARYDVNEIGHFGLAAKYYCHFTSPIRRYPDLQIHRILKEVLHGRFDENRAAHYLDLLWQTAKDCSDTERNAQQAERSALSRKKAQYMESRKGRKFRGLISGVVSYGFFVELENTVEGLVPIHSLIDDYYEYDEQNKMLTGEEFGRVFRLGDTVNVTVSRADGWTGKIDFIVNDLFWDKI